MDRKIQHSENNMRSWYRLSRDNIEKLQDRISSLQQVIQIDFIAPVLSNSFSKELCNIHHLTKISIKNDIFLKNGIKLVLHMSE